MRHGGMKNRLLPWDRMRAAGRLQVAFSPEAEAWEGPGRGVEGVLLLTRNTVCLHTLFPVTKNQPHLPSLK